MENNTDFVQGAIVLSGYEIESAITATACAAKEADGITLVILQNHLKNLCALQLKVLFNIATKDEVIDE